MAEKLEERAMDLCSSINAGMRGRQLRGVAIVAGNGLEDMEFCFTQTMHLRPNGSLEIRAGDLAMVVEEIRRQCERLDEEGGLTKGETWKAISEPGDDAETS